MIDARQHIPSSPIKIQLIPCFSYFLTTIHECPELTCGHLHSVANIKVYISRFILLLVALQLLNMSLYTPDFHSLSNHGDALPTEVNLTESVTEYVVEVMLGHKNAIPEISNKHGHDLHFHKHISFKATDEMTAYQLPELPSGAAAVAVPLNETYSYLFLREINPPPPKA